MKFIALVLFIIFPLVIFGQDLNPEDSGNMKSHYPEKSYFIAIPLSFFIGFGTGHFYAKDTWGGIRYIAYDIAGFGLGFLTLYFDDYSERSIIFAIAIAAVNRIYQAVSAAESVYYYNKNPLQREIDIFDDVRTDRRYLSFKSGNVLKLEIIRF